jgi:hypothetical protein
MSITKEQVERIPDVYRDFLLALAPVVESQRKGSVVKIGGVPFSHVFAAVSKLHDYDLPQVRELAHNLEEKGYIRQDRFGFLSPTSLGEEVIRVLIPSIDEPVVVPPLPDLN